MAQTARPKPEPSAIVRPGRAATMAIGWLAVALAYLVLFYATPLTHAAGGERVPRAAWLLLALTPEFYIETWTGGAEMRAAFFDRAGIASLALAILIAAYALGTLLLAAIDAGRGLSWVESFVFAEGVGLAAISLAVLGLGLLGVAHLPWFWLLGGGVLGVLFLGVVLRRHASPNVATIRAACIRGARSAETWWLILGLPLAAAIFLGAMLPPWEFDVREYHLQVPKEWFQRGRIDFLPHNVYGNMPLGAEVLAMPAMALWPGERDWWWGALVGKTVMAAFAPLTALALYAAGRRFFSPMAGAVAALVYLSTPWVAHTAMAGLNDHVLAFYVFASCYALWLWREEPNSASRLWLAGFLAGAAAACKYTGAAFAVAPVSALAAYWLVRRNFAPAAVEATPRGDASRGPAAWLMAGGFAASVALAAGPWYAKNLALAGNPVYPLLYDQFDGRTRTPEKAEQWRRAHQVPRSAEVGPYSPRRLAQSLAQVAWRSEWLSPLVVPLLILAPLQTRNRSAIGFAAGMLAYLLAVWWLGTHRIDRFWIPALPWAALLGGAGADWLAEAAGRRSVFGCLALGVAANLLVIASPSIGDNRFFVALEDLRADVGDPAANRIGRVNPAHHYLNQTVPPGGAALLVGDAQPFDLEVAALYNTCFDDGIFESLVQGRSPEEARAALREHNVTHVYVDWGEIARYRSPGNYGFGDFVQPAIFEELVRAGVLRPVWPADPFPSARSDGGLPPSQVYEVVPGL